MPAKSHKQIALPTKALSHPLDTLRAWDLANNAQLQGLLAPRKGSLSFRLSEIKDAKLFAEELYLGVLTRMPTEDEKKEVEVLLGKKDVDKAGLIRDLVWALMTSIEFRFQV